MSGLLRKYLKRVSASMNLDRSQRKCLFNEVQAELEEQLEDQNISNYADVVNALGTPEEFAEHLSEMEPFVCEAAAVKKNKKKLICTIIIITAIVVILAITCVWLALMQPGYYIVN